MRSAASSGPHLSGSGGFGLGSNVGAKAEPAPAAMRVLAARNCRNRRRLASWSLDNAESSHANFARGETFPAPFDLRKGGTGKSATMSQGPDTGFLATPQRNIAAAAGFMMQGPGGRRCDHDL